MDDIQIIEKLGGATAVAKLLGYKTQGGSQRVHNWLKRGIPYKVKVDHPDLFLVSISHDQLKEAS